MPLRKYSMSMLAAAAIGLGGFSFAQFASPVHAAAPAADAHADAERVLDRVSRAYRESPAITDAWTMTLGPQEVVLSIRIDENNNAEISAQGLAITILDEYIYVVSDVMPEKYARLDRGDEMDEVMQAVFGPGTVPPFHFAARQGKPAADIVKGFTLGLLPDPQVSGVETAERDGRTYHLLHYQDANGRMRVSVDASTNLVREIIITLSPMMEGDEQEVRIAADPKPGEQLDEPIRFDPGDREAVDSVEALAPPQPEPLSPGDEAPAFELQTLDGETVRLEDLRGNVVVLDFWATWCGPCIAAMPHLHAFAEWAEENDKPVKVYAVNVLEDGQTDSDRRQRASDLWERRNFTLPVLMDYTDELVAKYGIVALPTGVVIDPDGRVTAVHQGAGPDLKQVLINDTRRALGEDG